MASVLYHGSPVSGLSRLEPRPHPLLKGKGGVFATPDRTFALSMSAPGATDDRIAVGYETERGHAPEMYIDELEPGALEVFNRPAHLYSVSSKGFSGSPGLMRQESVNPQGVDIQDSEHIENIMEALKQQGVVINPYDKVPEHRQGPPQEKTAYTRIPKVSKSAVIITGNPAYIGGNPAAGKFYKELEGQLRSRGFENVSFDPGHPMTSPTKADLWVGHSRGADRLQFAPRGTSTIDLGPLEHPTSRARYEETQALAKAKGIPYSEMPLSERSPVAEHFLVTPDMLKAFDKHASLHMKKTAYTLIPKEARITPTDVHDAADAKGVAWDDNKSFMDRTEKLTGKRHLDDMSEGELSKVIKNLEKNSNTLAELGAPILSKGIPSLRQLTSALKGLKGNPALRAEASTLYKEFRVSPDMARRFPKLHGMTPATDPTELGRFAQAKLFGRFLSSPQAQSDARHAGRELLGIPKHSSVLRYNVANKHSAFKSEAQRRYFYANLPEHADKWEEETPKGKKLPEHVTKKEAARVFGHRVLGTKRREQDNAYLLTGGAGVMGTAAAAGALDLSHKLVDSTHTHKDLTGLGELSPALKTKLDTFRGQGGRVVARDINYFSPVDARATSPGSRQDLVAFLSRRGSGNKGHVGLGTGGWSEPVLAHEFGHAEQYALPKGAFSKIPFDSPSVYGAFQKDILRPLATGATPLVGAVGAYRALGKNTSEERLKTLGRTQLGVGAMALPQLPVLWHEADATARALRLGHEAGRLGEYARALGPAFGTYASALAIPAATLGGLQYLKHREKTSNAILRPFRDSIGQHEKTAAEKTAIIEAIQNYLAQAKHKRWAEFADNPELPASFLEGVGRQAGDIGQDMLTSMKLPGLAERHSQLSQRAGELAEKPFQGVEGFLKKPRFLPPAADTRRALLGEYGHEGAYPKSRQGLFNLYEDFRGATRGVGMQPLVAKSPISTLGAQAAGELGDIVRVNPHLFPVLPLAAALGPPGTAEGAAIMVDKAGDLVHRGVKGVSPAVRWGADTAERAARGAVTGVASMPGRFSQGVQSILGGVRRNAPKIIETIKKVE